MNLSIFLGFNQTHDVRRNRLAYRVWQARRGRGHPLRDGGRAGEAGDRQARETDQDHGSRHVRPRPPSLAHTFQDLSDLRFRYQDPFEDYKKRLAKKQAAAEDLSSAPAAGRKLSAKKEEDVNWFGEKIGRGAVPVAAASGRTGPAVGAGVGKYLNAGATPTPAVTVGVKRSLPAAASESQTKKKKKLGFGDFDSW